MTKKNVLLLLLLLIARQLVHAQTPVYPDLKTVLVRNGEIIKEPPLVKLVVYDFRSDNGGYLPALISDSHFVLDNNFFTIVYYLNPELKSLNLKPRQLVHLLKAPGDQKLNPYLSDGYQIALIADFNTKKEINQSINQIKNAWQKPATAESFDSDPSGKGLFDSINHKLPLLDIPQTLINQKTVVFNTEVLTNLSSELKEAAALINKSKKTADDFTALQQLMTDITSGAQQFTEIRDTAKAVNPYPNATVKVFVTDTLGKPAGQLRVYFVPTGLRSFPKYILPFPDFTSPSTRDKVTVANYQVWAGSPNDHIPLTDEFALDTQLFEGKTEVVIKLQLKKK